MAELVREIIEEDIPKIRELLKKVNRNEIYDSIDRL